MEVEGTTRHREAGDPVTPITTPVLDTGYLSLPSSSKEGRGSKGSKGKRGRNEKKKCLENLGKAIILVQAGKRKRHCSNPEAVRRNPPGGRDMG